MKRFSIVALARHAFGGHAGWGEQWRSPEHPAPAYEVVTTAYYLAREHGIGRAPWRRGIWHDLPSGNHNDVIVVVLKPDVTMSIEPAPRTSGEPGSIQIRVNATSV